MSCNNRANVAPNLWYISVGVIVTGARDPMRSTNDVSCFTIDNGKADESQRRKANEATTCPAGTRDHFTQRSRIEPPCVAISH
jgi:hypothetical protein